MSNAGRDSGASLWYSAAEYKRLAGDLLRRGAAVFELDTGADVSELFREFKSKLPLNPPISGRVRWDAFSDSLWEGLDEMADSEIAIIWRGAGRFRASDPQAFAIAEDVFSSVSSQVSGGEFGANPGKVVRLFFERD